MEKIRVTEYTERWGTGGVEAYIANLVYGLDAEKFDVTVLAAQRESDLYDEKVSHGCGNKSSIHILIPETTFDPIRRVMGTAPLFTKYIQDNPCDVLHLHISQGMALRYAKIAKQNGVKLVIAQSHNSRFGNKHFLIKWIAHKYGKYTYEPYVDIRLACSDKAAKWLFTQKDLESVAICNCLVDVDRFRFSGSDRKALRKKYELTNEKVYLTVGRIHYQKNPKFLLEIFCQLTKIDPDGRLVWIGTGEDSDEIHYLAEQRGISTKIIFVDSTLEIEKYMSMADAFLLPSLYEGNPIVVTEAQASGLPCFLSDAITKQAKILASTKYISLKESSEVWAKIIHNLKEPTESERMRAAEKIKQAGYDVQLQMNDMEKIYSMADNKKITPPREVVQIVDNVIHVDQLIVSNERGLAA